MGYEEHLLYAQDPFLHTFLIYVFTAMYLPEIFWYRDLALVISSL